MVQAGKVVEMGTHDQLMQLGGAYFALVAAQSGSGAATIVAARKQSVVQPIESLVAPVTPPSQPRAHPQAAAVARVVDEPASAPTTPSRRPASQPTTPSRRTPSQSATPSRRPVSQSSSPWARPVPRPPQWTELQFDEPGPELPYQTFQPREGTHDTWV